MHRDSASPILPPPSSRSPLSSAHAAERRMSSEQLLADRRQIIIEHAGQEYRLSVTRNDKLILTK
jgi:hemin uptake protein HemP